MTKANQIQIALMGVIILMLGYFMFTGGFGGSSDSSSEREKARQSLQANNPNVANNAAKPAVPAAPVGPSTVMNFSEKEFDFGNIDAGEKVTHVFKFENTGKEPLIISNAKGSCGCTVPKWPKEPIAVGESGEIEVVFDSKGKSGKQTKNVTITANTEPAATILKISADVAKDPNAPAATPAAKPTITPTIKTEGK